MVALALGGGQMEVTMAFEAESAGGAVALAEAAVTAVVLDGASAVDPAAPPTAAIVDDATAALALSSRARSPCSATPRCPCWPNASPASSTPRDQVTPSVGSGVVGALTAPTSLRYDAALRFSDLDCAPAGHPRAGRLRRLTAHGRLRRAERGSGTDDDGHGLADAHRSGQYAGARRGQARQRSPQHQRDRRAGSVAREGTRAQDRLLARSVRRRLAGGQRLPDARPDARPRPHFEAVPGRVPGAVGQSSTTPTRRHGSRSSVAAPTRSTSTTSSRCRTRGRRARSNGANSAA